MTDSIKLIFTYDDSVDAMVCTKPSYNEVYSFFQDIIHVVTPEEAALGIDSILAIPSYRSSLNVVGIFGPAEVTYRVFDSSQVNGDSLIEITGTNYWDQAFSPIVGERPLDFIVYGVALNTGIEMVSLADCITNPPSSGDATTIEITFFKDDNSKTVPEPEVYPSVARSLDKLVDKMEGNTVEVPGDPKVFETAFDYKIVNGIFQGHIYEPFTLNDEEEVTVELVHDNSVLSSLKLYKYISEYPGSDKMVQVIGYAYPKDPVGAADVFTIATDCESLPNLIGQFSAVGQCYTDFFEGKLPFPENYFGEMPTQPGREPYTDQQLYSDDYGLYLRFTGSVESKTVPAYETYKEAVPSVERSMWKIAEMFTPESKDENKEDSETVYDVNNTDRYEYFLNVFVSDTVPRFSFHDPVKGRYGPHSVLCDILKTMPFSINYFKANLKIYDTKMLFDKIRSSFAYVDSDNNIHSLISPSYGSAIDSGTTYYDALLIGEIIVTSNQEVDCSNLWAIVSYRNGGQEKLASPLNITFSDAN